MRSKSIFALSDPTFATRRAQLAQDPRLYRPGELTGSLNAPYELSDDDDDAVVVSTGCVCRATSSYYVRLPNIQRNATTDPLRRDKQKAIVTSSRSAPQSSQASSISALSSQLTAKSTPISTPSGSGDGEEELNLNHIPTGPELRRSSDETQKELKELFEGALGADLEVDMSKAEVDGFAKGIKLLPHQIQSRAWMEARETGKKCGGILGDVSLPRVH